MVACAAEALLEAATFAVRDLLADTGLVADDGLLA